MARKNPLGKIKDAAVETIKDPIGTGQKAVGQAVGQALGTIGTVTSTVGSVTSKVPGVPGRKRSSAKTAERPAERPRPVAVPDTPSRPHGDPVTPTKTEDRALRVEAPPSLASVAKQAPAKKAPATKAPATKAPATKAPTKQAAKKAPTKQAAKKAPAKKAAKAVPTPADVAKKTAARKTAAKTTAKTTAKKSPAKQAKKAPAKKTSATASSTRKRPLTAAELVAGAGTEVITPVGTRGAGVATNPDTNVTDLQQPGTAPLMDPGTVKAVTKEADMLRRAADPNKG